jgi:hypothetical protein
MIINKVQSIVSNLKTLRLSIDLISRLNSPILEMSSILNNEKFFFTL